MLTSVPQVADRLVFSSREFLRLLEVHELTGSWGWTFATDEHIWSPGLFRLLGLEPGVIRPSYARFLALVHPEDRPAVETAAQVMQDGVMRDRTVRVIRPDGSLRVLSCRGEIYHDPDGRPRAAAGTVLDVTDRERLATVQAHERRRRRALFEQTQSWTHASLYAQAQRVGSQELLILTGVTQEAFRQDCTLVVASDDRNRTRDHVQAMMQAGRPFVTDKQLILAEGGHAWFRFVYAPVRDDRDAVVTWATMASRVGGAPAAPVDEGVRQGLESGVSGRHVCAARALLGWSMQDLATFSGVSLSSIRRLEDDGGGLTARTRGTIVATLREAGIGFTLTDGNAIAVYRK
ncbi:histidine kinase [Methylobacterium variabile]|jgi:PAS domain S-box-containing protein|uniref:histidine kinase n=1 Tax=Methylobacterium variabile TaxID=298794 RepID=A0A0J6SDQ9_9HYPH|nr:PAS domain-containing protein [Methylobacterium variabile]KMO31847.1 histidine kinase [Methylobacterium variabile]